MVLHDVVQVGSGHLEGIRVQPLTGNWSLRLPVNRFQLTHIADAGIASVALGLVEMDDSIIIDRQEIDFAHHFAHHFANRSKSSPNR